MTITAKYQGTLNIPLYDTGIRPTTNGVDAGSYFCSFPSNSSPTIKRNYRQPTSARFYEIVGFNVTSASGHVLSMNYNSGNLDPGLFDGSYGWGSIYGGLYYTMSTCSISGYDGYVGFACVPWNGLFNQTFTTPIILNMALPPNRPGTYASRGFYSINNQAFYGCNLSGSEFLLYNPYINNILHPFTQINVTTIPQGNFTVPDFVSMINYTVTLTNTVPTNFLMTKWGLGVGDVVDYGTGNTITGQTDTLVFDDSTIASNFFGSNVWTVAWNPQGFLFSSSATIPLISRSLFLSKDGTRYWLINYTPPAGMSWSFIGGASGNFVAAASVDNFGVVTTNAYLNPIDSNKVYTLSSLAFSIPWNPVGFNFPPVEVSLPCMSSCLGKNFGLTKL